MTVGCLGEVVFEVSDKAVETVNTMEWSGSARYAVHERHLNHALTEFCGLDPDKIEIEIILSTDLGVDPLTELDKLWGYERGGVAVPFILGGKAYGKHRWNITGHKVVMEHTDVRGLLSGCKVAVSLLEFLQW